MCLGIPGQVVAITDAEAQLGIVDISGVHRTVNLVCVAGGDLAELIGAWVLVHVGFAMSRIDPDEAARTLALLHELGEAEPELAVAAAGVRPDHGGPS